MNQWPRVYVIITCATIDTCYDDAFFSSNIYVPVYFDTARKKSQKYSKL